MSTTMEQYDGKSILGSAITFLFTFLSAYTLTEWATIMAIGAGATTILYNIVKTVPYLKRKKRKP